MAFPGSAYLAGETDGMAIDFAYDTDRSLQMQIKTSGSGANSDPFATLTYTSPSLKLCRQSDGVWRYGNHNLCLQSQDFGTTWTTSNLTVSTNSVTAPDGTATADAITGTSSDCNIRQTAISGVEGQSFYCSIWAKVPSGTLTVRNYLTDQNGTAFNVANTIGLTTTWQQFSFTVTANSGATTSVIFQVGGFSTIGNGDVVHLWGAQVKRAPVNDAGGGFTLATGYIATTAAARYDLPYEWDAAGDPLGILIEEARTNQLTRSQEFDHADWTKEQASVTANSTAAPDGTTTGDTFKEDSSTNVHRVYESAKSISGNTTLSVFAKASGVGSTRYLTLTLINTLDVYISAIFDLAGSGSVTKTGVGSTGGVYTSSSIAQEANGWYRCTLTGDILSTATAFPVIGLSNSSTGTFTSVGQVSYAGDNTSGLFIWNAMHEIGSFATSPIHTVGSTVTRAVDAIALATSSFPVSASVGTLISRYDLVGVTTNNAVITSLRGNSGNDLVVHQILTGTTLRFVLLDNGGTTTVVHNKGAPTTGSVQALGSAWASTDFATALNGAAPTTSSDAGAMPTFDLDMGIGWTNGGTDQICGHIRQITYLARRATNGELQTFTGPDWPTGYKQITAGLGTYALSGTAATLTSSVVELQLDLKSYTTTGSMSAASTTLTVASNPGFQIGDPIIVEIGGEAGGGLRGTAGVGGVWPAKSYANAAAMNADISQADDTYAWLVDTGRVWQFDSGSSTWTIRADVHYYTNKAIPKALVTTISNIVGTTFTLADPSVAATTNANVYYDNTTIINDACGSTSTVPALQNIVISAGSFAVGNSLVYSGSVHDGRVLRGQGAGLSELFSPQGAMGIFLLVFGTTNSKIQDFSIRGNCGDNGFGLIWDTTTFGAGPYITETSISSEAYQSGVWHQFATGDLALWSMENIDIYDCFRPCISIQSTNITAKNCRSVRSVGLQQYIQWDFQWANSTGGLIEDCTVDSPDLICGFESFNTSNVRFVRPIGRNAVTSLNSANNCSFESPTLTIEDDVIPEFWQDFSWPSTQVMQTNRNALPLVGSNATISNPTIIQEGHFDGASGHMMCIVNTYENFTMSGGYPSNPSAGGLLMMLDGATSALGAPSHINVGGGPTTVVSGIRLIGSSDYQFLSEGLVTNCVFDTRDSRYGIFANNYTTAQYSEIYGGRLTAGYTQTSR